MKRDADEYDCIAEFIDGSMDTCGCGCPECVQQRADDIEHLVEAGDVDEDEARDMHIINGSWCEEEAAFYAETEA